MSAEVPSGAGDLSARGLRLARLAWLLVVVVGLALVALELPGQYQQYVTVCPAPPCANLQLSPAQAAALPRLGLSLPAVGALFTALSLLQTLAFVAIGALIFWRRGADRAALILSCALTAFGLGSSLGSEGQPAGLVHLLTQLFQVLGNAGIVLFFFLFPDGRFYPRWTRWLAPVAVAREALSVFYPESIFNNLFVLVVPFVALLQIVRYRHASSAVQRQQTKWVVYGCLLGLGLFVGLLLFNNAYVHRVGAFGALAVILIGSAVSLALTLIPVSVGIAILRYRLWDIDVLIRRTLVYGALTALLAAVYLGSVVVLQIAFIALTGQQRSGLVTVLSTLAIAALFVPLRARLQGFIDRRFYRRKYDAARILAGFGAALRADAAADLERLRAQLLDVVEETMEPASVGLLLVGDDQK